jgi:hypothetical protein
LTWPALGCDPGSTSGALVLRDDRRVLAWWAYCKVSDGLRVRGVNEHAPMFHVAPTVADVARYIIHNGPGAFFKVPLVLEGLYVEPFRGGRKVNPQDTIKLAESAGALDAILGPAAARPLFTQWTSRLGVRDSVHAVEIAARLSWPGPGWAAVKALTQDELGAVAEAACMAAWLAGITGQQARPAKEAR